MIAGDETFDFSAMGRLFCGLCQVGAWGCFDEFNRLEERILSAVSQQILTIQRGLLERENSIELLGRSIKLHENVGIFVTMNPGYAGRSNLPDNLKTLFRSVAMVIPDRKLIAQVMLYSQGIVTAEQLSGKVVDLFLKCEGHMSKQSHYDFGLRALKTLLVSAGGLKRKALEGQDGLEGDELASVEKTVLIQGACNNVVPKLVADDIGVFETILGEIFPGSEVAQMKDDKLKAEVVEACKNYAYVPGDKWLQKILQLKQVLEMRHGVMAVGPSGVGKSSALRVLLDALEKTDGTKGEMYVIDPKAMDKEGLYGVLDGTTMEWTDGVFTGLLRTILANQKGEADRRHWIVFDGDVDPEWAENLNR
jgi:dynein heavy chain 1